MTYTLSRASQTDTAAVAGLLTARADWLAEHGHDQWSEKDPARTSSETIATGETWLLRAAAAGEPVGTLTMTTRADRDFWTPDELAEPALYMSKLATRPDLAGQGLGVLLLYAAYIYARKRGVHTLRWDVWRTNRGLQTYYEGLGAVPVRSVEVPGRRSGVLYEWRSLDRDIWLTEAMDRVTLDAPTGVVTVLQSTTHYATQILGQEGSYPIQNESGPTHWHHVQGLTREAHPQPLVVTPGDPVPWLLFHSGASWRGGVGGYNHLVAGAVLDQLTPGLLYRVQHTGVGAGCQAVITGDLINHQPAADVPIAGC